ncbi:hypothetical protein [Consotaella aegiceratis]|uniref:hypothetical protein n=1 Tax=Consotaella aegiceratis TaxID=3097961 RepID=UPI002F3E2D72
MRIPTKTLAALLALGVSVPALALGPAAAQSNDTTTAAPAAAEQQTPPPMPGQGFGKGGPGQPQMGSNGQRMGMGMGPGPMGPRGHHMGRDGGPRVDARGPMNFGGGMGGGFPGMQGGPNPLMLAGGLNAAETALGITTDQQDAWNGFTTAFLDFADTMHPGPFDGPDGPAQGDQPDGPMGGPGGPGAPDGAMTPPPAGAPQAQDQAQAPATASEERTLTDLPAVKMLDFMIDRQAERAEAAQNLRSAIDDLSAVLTPDQVEKADQLLSQLRPGGRGMGMHHRDGRFQDGQRGHHGPRFGPDSSRDTPRAR